ncbi:MAG: enolase C-terminal domain-like protein [Planctomycetota bacterium]|nr:enolase C-terminal domain-like protein [Planctomycetota bacterium]
MLSPAFDSKTLTIPRRDFLKRGIAGAAIGGACHSWYAGSALALPAEHQLTIRKIERITVKVPYRKIPARHMARELPHWRYSEIFKVHLRSGHVGYGETLLYYTWDASEDDDVRRAQGKNAAALMWDDELGAGLQMALFDAVAKTADVPIHRLLGAQIHDKTPLSWWNIDTSPEDMAAECREAHRQGYLAYKTKGRPWIDLWGQVEQSAKVVPESFKIDMDFNDTLLDARRAIPILKEIAADRHIDIYETPIFQTDIPGNQAIRKATRVALAMHYGNPDAVTAIKHGICDGFIIGGGASRVMRQAAVSAAADMPFWLQLVGTGITAAWSLHFGGVLSHATWPAVNCHQLYTHQLLTKPIQVRDGFAQVPNRSGLGVEIDWEAIDRFRVEKPKQRPEPARLIETRWPDGQRMLIANNGKVNFMLDVARRGKMPFFKRGVTTRLVADDGTESWRTLYNKARRGPVFEGA